MSGGKGSRRLSGKFHPEYRFARSTKRGCPPAYRPELGPCLIFTGTDNGNGYGQFTYNGRTGYIHRYAWERVHGPIPDGLTVDHLCRVRMCAEVAHMELVDAVTNFRRGAAARTTCRHGHEYTPGNTLRRNGMRKCRTCLNRNERAYAERRREHRGPDPRVKYDLKLRDKLVRQVVAGEKTVRVAADELGCSAKYIDKLTRAARRRAGDTTSRNLIPEETRQQILAFLRDGVSKKEIGRICKVSPTTVTNIERRACNG